MSKPKPMDEFESWLDEITNPHYCGDRPCIEYLPVADDGDEESWERRVRLYTDRHVFAIRAWVDAKSSYLGCILNVRKPRAGEDWMRGSDLPDGDFSRQTWNEIKNAIIACELVPLAKKEERLNKAIEEK